MTQKAVLLDTSLGPITLELYWDHAPKACENFYTLVQQGFYNGVIFHRIIKVLYNLEISMSSLNFISNIIFCDHNEAHITDF